jgi:NAD(P)-dependent dehydrogenase (short-subunit alcohol dehydrogenase family)
MSRVAVITGGGRGIGAATARRLAADGWDVVIGYRHDRIAADAVVADVGRAGRRSVAVAGEVTDDDAVRELFDAGAALGQIGAVVNNAGVVSPAGRVDSYEAGRIREVLEINVVGAFLVAGEAVRRMSTVRGGSGGVIVNVSSRAAVLGSAGEYVDYAASKAAVDTLTVGLAHEVAREGIRVVGVRPGLIATEIHAPGRLERLGSSPPLGRPGTAEEVANAIAWLVSPEASYVTAATLDIGGGR